MVFLSQNKLNAKLKEREQFVHKMVSNIKTLKVKMTLFSEHITYKSFAHFRKSATG